MLITVLALLPWVVASIILLFILNSSRKYFEQNQEEFDFEIPDITRVAVYKDKAYWVHENIFYQSEVTWEPDFTTAEPIDTMSLSSKEVNELLIILDELREEEKES
jgi:hypothetical protein